MTFTRDFITAAIKEHNKWIDKINYIVDVHDIPILWKPQLTSNKSEIQNLLSHLRSEIHDADSVYSELRYELEYSHELLNKMFLHANVICLLIELIKRRSLGEQVTNAIKSTIDIVAQELHRASDDIVSRMTRWKEISI